MINDTDNYLLVKPYTISVSDIQNPVKTCRLKCNFSSIKKLKCYLEDIFVNPSFKRYFKDKNKSIVLMYIMDNQLQLNLELLLLNNKTNKLKRFAHPKKTSTKQASSSKKNIKITQKIPDKSSTIIKNLFI